MLTTAAHILVNTEAVGGVARTPVRHRRRPSRGGRPPRRRGAAGGATGEEPPGGGAAGPGVEMGGGPARRWAAARRGQDGGAAGEEPPGLRRGGAREAGGGGCEADGGKAAGTRDLARGQGRHAWEGDRRGRDRVVDPMAVVVCTNLKHWKLPGLYFIRKIDRNCGNYYHITDHSNKRPSPYRPSHLSLRCGPS